jgi:hypothetical protein
LKNAGLNAEAAATWADAVMALFQTGKERSPSEDAAKKGRKGKASKQIEEDDEVEPEDVDSAATKMVGGGRQILTLGESEIAALSAVAAALHKAGIDSSEMRGLIDKPTKRRAQAKEVQNALGALDAVRSNAGLDGALFGRMATGIALSRVDSAVHVGHALTTHPIQSSVDFFSAQDQLLDREAGESGGAHIGSRELAAGVFYLPVVIDLVQLQKNFAEWSDVEIAKVVGWLVKSIATFTPAAMLGSTAPFPDPGEVVVEVTTGQPVNAMGAFERPVAPTLDASVAAFNEHIQRVWAMIGRPAKVLRLSDFVDPKSSSPAVQQLADAVANVMHAMATAPRVPNA